LGAVMLAVFIVFVMQNLSQVTVNFLIFRFSMPRAVLLSATLLTGILIGILLHFEIGKGRRK